VTLAWIVYVAGVTVGLWRTDAPWPMRVVLAALWPIGPAAFVVTVSLLLAVSLFVFPIVGALAAAGLLGWLWLSLYS
jgi:hypothetical protein